jgi:hypothetical protein
LVKLTPVVRRDGLKPSVSSSKITVQSISHGPVKEVVIFCTHWPNQWTLQVKHNITLELFSGQGWKFI